MNRSARFRRTAARLAGALTVLLAAVAIAAALPPSAATAAETSTPGLRIPPLDPQLPWTIEADHLTHDPERDEYVAEGNVLLAKMDRAISADRVRYSRRDRMAGQALRSGTADRSGEKTDRLNRDDRYKARK